MSWCFNCEGEDGYPKCCGVHFCGVWVLNDEDDATKGGHSCGKPAVCQYTFIADRDDDELPHFHYCVDHFDDIVEADKEGRYDDDFEEDDDE